MAKHISEAERTFNHIVIRMGTKYWFNPKLKACSRSLKSLTDKCFEETRNEPNNIKLMELNDATDPASMIKYHYLRFFRGYQTI